MRQEHLKLTEKNCASTISKIFHSHIQSYVSYSNDYYNLKTVSF